MDNKQKKAYQQAAEKYSQLQNFYKEYQTELEGIYVDKPDTLQKVVKMLEQAKKKFEDLDIDLAPDPLQFKRAIEAICRELRNSLQKFVKEVSNVKLSENQEEAVRILESVDQSLIGKLYTINGDYIATAHARHNLINAIDYNFSKTIPGIVGVKEELYNTIKNLPAEATIKDLCDELIEILKLYADGKKEDEIIEKDCVSPEDVRANFITAEQLIKVLEQAIPDDAYENNEEEEDREELEDKYKNALKKWSEDCDLAISAIGTLRLRKISKKLLQSKMDWAFNSCLVSPVRVAFQKELLDKMEDDDSDGMNKLTYEGLVIKATTVKDEICTNYNIDKSEILYNFWVNDSSATFPNPGRVANWLEFGVPMDQIAFEEALHEWLEKTETIISDLYGEKSWTKFKYSRFISEISDVFRYDQETIKLYKDYIAPILNKNKQEIISAKDLHKLWKDAIDHLDKSSSKIYEDYLSRGISLSEVIEALPQASEFGMPLDQSEYYEALDNNVLPTDDGTSMLLPLAIRISPDLNAMNSLISSLLLDQATQASGTAPTETQARTILHEAMTKVGGTVILQIPLEYSKFQIQNTASWFCIPKKGNISWDSVNLSVNISNSTIRALNKYEFSDIFFEQKYRISITYSLPEATISAGNSVSNMIGLSNDWAVQYGISPKMQTIQIDFSIRNNYQDKKLTIEIKEGDDIKIHAAGSNGHSFEPYYWLDFKEVKAERKTIKLSPF